MRLSSGVEALFDCNNGAPQQPTRKKAQTCPIPNRAPERLVATFSCHLSHRRHPRVIVDGKKVGALRPLLERSRLRIEPVVENRFTAGKFDLTVRLQSNSANNLDSVPCGFRQALGQPKKLRDWFTCTGSFRGLR